MTRLRKMLIYIKIEVKLFKCNTKVKFQNVELKLRQKKEFMIRNPGAQIMLYSAL